MSPTSQGDMRTEAVQPDALKAGTKINQQLGYSGQDPQKVSIVLLSSPIELNQINRCAHRATNMFILNKDRQPKWMRVSVI